MNEQTQFKVDTSGAVRMKEHHPGCVQCVIDLTDLSPFQQGAESDARRELAERLMREGMTADQAREATAFHRWHPSALQRIMADCERAVDLFVVPMGPLYNANVAGGRCFWSDRQASYLGEEFPPLTISLAEDGLIHLSEVAS